MAFADLGFWRNGRVDPANLVVGIDIECPLSEGLDRVPVDVLPVEIGDLLFDLTDAVGLTSAVASEREAVREDQLEEMVGVVSQTFLGLTANCARCHDHKFDPIPQRDYYRFKAALSGVWQPFADPASTELFPGRPRA